MKLPSFKNNEKDNSNNKLSVLDHSLGRTTRSQSSSY